MKAVRAATAEEVTGNDNCTSAFKPHEPAHSAPHIVSYWTYNPIPMVITDRKGSMVNEYHPKGPSITEAPQTSNVYQA